MNLNAMVNKITNLIIAAHLTLVSYSYSQESHKHTIYADVNTSGPVYSLNYDRIFHRGENVFYAYRIGLHWLHDEVALPLGISLITGKQNHHMEFSLSFTPYIDRTNYLFREGNISDKYLYITPGIGYRFQKPGGGLFVKSLVAPLILLDPPSDDFWKMDGSVDPLLSVGLGFTF
jgi:hypothetical protein